jgi:hypothetical protein
MKLNRRGFFGAAAGAALAPSLQADAVAGGPLDQLVGYGVPAIAKQSACVPQPDPNYIEHLKRRVAGELSDWERDRIEERRREAHAQAALSNLDALRSVSAPIKRLMLAEHYERQMRGDFMRNAISELRMMMQSPSKP